MPPDYQKIAACLVEKWLKRNVRLAHPTVSRLLAPALRGLVNVIACALATAWVEGQKIQEHQELLKKAA